LQVHRPDGIRVRVERGWLDLHESGTYVRIEGEENLAVT
jgi:hypothetical protein